MTPEPDPDPPTPSTRSYKFYLSDSFNNAHMLRIYGGSTSTPNELISGTRISITPATELTISIPESGDYYLVFKVKGYDNTHPDYEDSYYDDSSTCTLFGVPGGSSSWNIGSQTDGSEYTVTYSNTNAFTVVARS